MRRRLERRAGLRREDEGPRIGAIRSYVDLISPRSIAGWAENIDYPEAPVCFDICASGRLVGQTLANRYREDLKRAGLGSGHHSFAFAPSAGATFTLAAIEVCRSLDGATLPLSADARQSLARTATRKAEPRRRAG